MFQAMLLRRPPWYAEACICSPLALSRQTKPAVLGSLRVKGVPAPRLASG